MGVGGDGWGEWGSVGNFLARWGSVVVGEDEWGPVR